MDEFLDELIWQNKEFLAIHYRRIVIMDRVLSRFQGAQYSTTQLMDRVKNVLDLENYSLTSFNTDLRRWRELMEEEYQDENAIVSINQDYSYRMQHYRVPIFRSIEE